MVQLAAVGGEALLVLRSASTRLPCCGVPVPSKLSTTSSADVDGGEAGGRREEVGQVVELVGRQRGAAAPWRRPSSVPSSRSARISLAREAHGRPVPESA